MVTHQRLKASSKRSRLAGPNCDDYMMIGTGTSDADASASRRRRNTVAAAAALGVAASVILLSDGLAATGTTASGSGGGIGLRRALQVIEDTVATSNAPPSTASNPNAAAVQATHHDIFEAEFLPNPNPTTLDCMRHFLGGRWHNIEDVPQPVPTGSKFQLNNDFTTVVKRSNLNILFLGDSVGENMYFMVEQSFGLDKDKRDVGAYGTNRKGKTQEKIYFNQIPAERGGGYLGFARVLDMFQNIHQGTEWTQWDPQHFADFTAKHGKVDLIFYRTPWPWLTLVNKDIVGNISVDDYTRTMDVIYQQFQPRLGVIMTTSAVNNNGVRDGFVRLRKDNEVIRTFVNSYSPPLNPSGGVQNLVLMDWEKLTDELVKANAQTLGIPAERAFSHYVTGEAVPEAHMYSPEGNRYFFPQLTAMACATNVELSDEQNQAVPPSHPTSIDENRVGTCPDLKRGIASPDGMHWCSSTAGPRTSGGFVCLTKCILAKENASRRGDDRAKQFSDLRLCQDRCNNLFMNMDSSYADGYVHVFGERPGMDLEKDVTAIER